MCSKFHLFGFKICYRFLFCWTQQLYAHVNTVGLSFLFTRLGFSYQKASVPFSFQNRSNVPLRVELRIISERITVEDFDDGESTTIVLNPGVTTHNFRLRALGSGSFPISIELHSPNGGLIVGKAQAALRATTPTGVGLGLTIGAAVFLACWWFIDTRRRKSQNRENL